MSKRNDNPRPMTKEELLAYKAGYEAVNALEIEELRSMSIERSSNTRRRLWKRLARWAGERRWQQKMPK